MNVKSIGGQIHPFRKKGDFSFQFPNGKLKTILDVLYVLGVKKNLILVGALTDKGLLAIFSDTSYFLTIRGKHQIVVAKGIRDPIFGLCFMNFTQSSKSKIN